MSHRGKRFLFWSPRILAIAFAAFISIFALDVFAENAGFWRTAQALIIHLTPTALIVAILLAAWRWEWVGALVFALLGALCAYHFVPINPVAVIAISGPLLLIAGLFLVDWIAERPSRAAL